jgi:hypothetical protein
MGLELSTSDRVHVFKKREKFERYFVRVDQDVAREQRADRGD